MRMKEFLGTWTELHQSNRFLKAALGAMLIVNLLLAAGLLLKDRTLVLLPPGLNEAAELSRRHASEGYKKAWGVHAATLLGNVTPDNADFVLKSLQDMVSGDIRQDIHAQVAQALGALRQERVSSVFDLRQVAYEPQTDKVFVSGRANLVGAGGKGSYSDQAYEFQIDVRQYSPVIAHLALYPGAPRTLEAIQREEARRQAEKPH
jgi:conjugal transfer pilus assembly protein TraE